MVVGDQDGSHINANVSHPNVSKAVLGVLGICVKFADGAERHADDPRLTAHGTSKRVQWRLLQMYFLNRAWKYYDCKGQRLDVVQQVDGHESMRVKALHLPDRLSAYGS